MKHLRFAKEADNDDAFQINFLIPCTYADSAFRIDYRKNRTPATLKIKLRSQDISTGKVKSFKDE